MSSGKGNEITVMKKAIQTIPLSKIDLTDETFSVNFMPDVERLSSSIRQIGQIQPVFLRPKGDRYQIICGFRRVWIARDLGHSEIDARITQEADELRLFLMSLHENVTTRGFNTVEVATALAKLVHHFNVDPANVIEIFLPLFSQETNEKILNTFLSLARMEEDVKTYVLRGKVSRTNIRLLATFPEADRNAIVPLVSPLKLTESRLREILSLLSEISRKDQRPVSEVIAAPEIQDVLHHPELTFSQKSEKIKGVLMKLRYPRMHALEESFEKRRKMLNLPSSVSVHHSPYFEGKGLRVKFDIETLEQYEAVLSSLSFLAKDEAFQGMLIPQKKP